MRSYPPACALVVLLRWTAKLASAMLWLKLRVAGGRRRVRRVSSGGSSFPFPLLVLFCHSALALQQRQNQKQRHTNKSRPSILCGRQIWERRALRLGFLRSIGPVSLMQLLVVAVALLRSGSLAPTKDLSERLGMKESFTVLDFGEPAKAPLFFGVTKEQLWRHVRTRRCRMCRHRPKVTPDKAPRRQL